MSVPAFADYSTTISYTGTGTEDYLLTVPSELSPGDTGEVTLEGTWPTTTTINVTADESVTLTNSIDNSTKNLDIDFNGISQDGSNTAEITVTEDISVDDIENALFGVWSGRFNYNVSVDEEIELIEFTYYWDSAGMEFTRTVEAGATWAEIIDTDSNLGYTYIDETGEEVVIVGDDKLYYDSNATTVVLLSDTIVGNAYYYAFADDIVNAGGRVQ